MTPGIASPSNAATGAPKTPTPAVGGLTDLQGTMASKAVNDLGASLAGGGNAGASIMPPEITATADPVTATQQVDPAKTDLDADVVPSIMGTGPSTATQQGDPIAADLAGNVVPNTMQTGPAAQVDPAKTDLATDVVPHTMGTGPATQVDPTKTDLTSDVVPHTMQTGPTAQVDPTKTDLIDDVVPHTMQTGPTTQVDPVTADLADDVVPHTMQTGPAATAASGGVPDLEETMQYPIVPGSSDAASNVSSGLKDLQDSTVFGNVLATGDRPENATVFDFQAPDNPLLPRVREGQSQMLDMLAGEGELPYVEPLMAAQRDAQEREMQDLNQSLAMRGLGNSTVADEARARLNRQHQAGLAQTSMQGLQTVMPAYRGAYGDVFQQGLQGRQQSVNEFLNFLDRQTQMTQWDKGHKNQVLALMLNALGQGTINPQMPNYNVPSPAPGPASSIGQIAGNIAPNLPWDKWL